MVSLRSKNQVGLCPIKVFVDLAIEEKRLGNSTVKAFTRVMGKHCEGLQMSTSLQYDFCNLRTCVVNLGVVDKCGRVL